MPGFKLERGMFTNDDLSTMLMALGGLKDMVSQDVLANVEAKLRSLIPNQHAPYVQIKSNCVRIDRFPWICNRDFDDHLALIREALNNCNPVQITYVNHRGEESRRVVEPHQIVFKNGAPYVYGWCRKRRAFRLFKFSRILNLQVIDETFDFREMPAAELDGTPYAQELQETITLRIRRSLAERVLDYCPYERFTPDGDGHYLVNFPFIDHDYYYDLLLFFGEDCEVLGPSSVRKKMAGKLERLSKRYG